MSTSVEQENWAMAVPELLADTTTILTCPRKKIPPPTMKAEIAVPITAKSVMEPMFWKKLP